MNFSASPQLGLRRAFKSFSTKLSASERPFLNFGNVRSVDVVHTEPDPTTTPKRRRRKMSAAAKKAIGLAQKKRWAEWRKKNDAA